MKALEVSLSMNAAHQYVTEQLRDGNALAQIILQQIPFEKGRFIALLHPTADKNKIYDFKAGGILPQNPLESIAFAGKLYPGRKKGHSDQQLAEYLKNAMHPESCCYFEDVLHRRQDPIAMKFKANTFYYLEKPYLFLQSSYFSLERAVEMIHFANAQWYYMNVVSAEKPGSIHDVAEDKLTKIATKATHVVVGAYDMEGFVVWSLTP